MIRQTRLERQDQINMVMQAEPNKQDQIDRIRWTRSEGQD